MSGFDDGPLTGAPISFPKSSQEGECCPPVLAQGFYQVQGGLASTKFFMDGEKLAEVTDVQIKGTQNTTTAPTFISADVTENAGFLDLLGVVVNTTGINNGDQFAVTVTNECGCCATAIVNVVVA